MKRFSLGLGVAVAVLLMFFHQGGHANANSRLLTVYALVEDHHLWADRWKDQTGDYSVIKGHIYSDKAPFSSLVVLPFYWALRTVEGGKQTDHDRELIVHVAVVIGAVLPCVAIALLLWRKLRASARSAREAVWLTLAVIFSTPLALYGGAYFGHELAAALFLGSYVLAVEQERHFVWAGLLGGLSVLTEYPLLVPQVFLCGYLLLTRGARVRALDYVCGAVPAAALLVTYNRGVTGSWFDFPYSHVNEAWAAMHTAFGIRMPSPEALWELCFGQYRGLAFYAPVLLLLVPMLVRNFDGPSHRRNLVLLILGSQLLFVAAYFKWDGGWCYGPRHLVPALALACYEGVAVFARQRGNRVMFALLTLWGVVAFLAAAATDPLPAESFTHPFFDVFWPKLLNNDLTNHSILVEAGLPKGLYLIGLWFGLFAGFSLGLGWLADWPERKQSWVVRAAALINWREWSAVFAPPATEVRREDSNLHHRPAGPVPAVRRPRTL